MADLKVSKVKSLRNCTSRRGLNALRQYEVTQGVTHARSCICGRVGSMDSLGLTSGTQGVLIWCTNDIVKEQLCLR